jgi:FAD/FMN-containing dehydrogenase
LRTLTDKKLLDEYSRDAGILTIEPRAVLFADDEGDLLQAVQKANRDAVPITPRGSGTSIPSHSVGSGYVVVQTQKEVRISGKEFSCTPAVIKADLNITLGQSNLWMPVDPSSYRACSIGGMVSNNSSGARTLKHGSTIDYVKELTVVLPEEGRRVVKALPLEEALHGDISTRKVANLVADKWKAILREKPKTTKNSSGYRLERLIHDGLFDLPKLFVGSEGTLGLISRITSTTRERPPLRSLLVISIDSLKDLEVVVEELRVSKPSAVELLDKSIFLKAKRRELLRQFPGPETGYLVYAELEGKDESELESVFDQVAENEKLVEFDPLLLREAGEMSKAWETRDLTLAIAGELRSGNRYPVPGVEDLVVPPGKLRDLLALVETTFTDLGLEFISYGHAGDANLHVRPLLDPSDGRDKQLLSEIMRSCFEEVWKMGGSITGEHGDGLLRAEYVKEQYPETYELMVQIKEVYDPKWLMNPGVKLERP